MIPRTPDRLTTSRTVGTTIRRLRLARGWSVAGMVPRTEAAGHRLNHGAIRSIELGYGSHGVLRSVSVDELVVLARVLGVQPAELLTPFECRACQGAPPAGFTCQTCGAPGGAP